MNDDNKNVRDMPMKSGEDLSSPAPIFVKTYCCPLVDMRGNTFLAFNTSGKYCQLLL